MKLAEEQILKIQLYDANIKLNQVAIQNLKYGLRDMSEGKQDFVDALINEASIKEEKPLDKFDVQFNPLVWEITFREKEGKDAIRPD